MRVYTFGLRLEMGKGEIRIGEKREDRVGNWGRGCKEAGRRTKRIGELLMRASRLGLSTNARTQTHTRCTQAFTQSMDIVTHYISCAPFLSPSSCHHPQPQFSPSVLLSLATLPQPVFCHAIPITSSTVLLTPP